MRYHLSRAGFLAAILVCALLLQGCTEPESPPVPTFTLPASSPAPEEITYTKITIDGSDSDWAAYPLSATDPAGDQVAGSPDLLFVRAINYGNHFCLLINLNETGTTDHYDILLDIDGQDFDYQVSVWPGQDQAYFSEFPVTSGMAPVSGVISAQQGTNIEVGIPLAVINGQPVTAAFVQTFLGDRTGDQVNKFNAVQVSGGEVDIAGSPPEVVQNQATAEPIPTAGSTAKDYAGLWNLPENYLGEALLISPVGNNGGLTRSASGYIYLKTWGSEAGVSLLDLNGPTVTRLFDVPPDAGMSDIIGGPGDTVFMNVVAEVWQISPDGSHTVWGIFPDAFIVAYTSEGRMLGKTHDGTTLLELHPDGSMETIATGFNNILDALEMPDGALVLYEWNTGDIVRLDTDGSRRILVPRVMPGDFANLGLDFDGQLYMNSAGTYGFKRMDASNGQLTDIPGAYSRCIMNPNDFVFIEPGKILLTGDQLSQADINSGENGLVIQNIASTFAAAIGPDDALYIGASGCEGQMPARILRFDSDGSQSVFIDNLEGTIQKMVFAPQGDLYLAARYGGKNHLLYIAAGTDTPVEIPGAPSEIVMGLAYQAQTGHIWISRQRGTPLLEYDRTGQVGSHPVKLPGNSHQFIIDFSPDGSLYAYVGRTDDPTGGPWLVRIDPVTGGSTVITELPREPAGAGMGAFSVDPRGNLWTIINPESILYQVTPDGTVTPFATNLPIDAFAVTINGAGDIYFTCSSGIFRISEEQ